MAWPSVSSGARPLNFTCHAVSTCRSIARGGELGSGGGSTTAWALALTLTTERGDLVNIVLTARSEPFEGINETINLQWDGVIAKIDDFRRQSIWRGPDLRRYHYWPKDVGHAGAIAQPFGGARRDWAEVEVSALLTLECARLVVAGERIGEVRTADVAALRA